MILVLTGVFAAPFALIVFPLLLFWCRAPYSVPLLLVSWAAFFSLLTSTKFPESDLLLYLEIYEDLGRQALADVFSYAVLSIRVTEVAYSIYSYLISTISGGSAFAFVFLTSFLIYLFVVLIAYFAFVGGAGLSARYAHDRSPLLTKNPYAYAFLAAMALASFVAITFSLSGHLVRQYLAGSVLFFGFAVLIFSERRWVIGSILILLAPLIHNSAAIPAVITILVFVLRHRRAFLWPTLVLFAFLGYYGVTFIPGYDSVVSEATQAADEGAIHPVIVAADVALVVLALGLNSAHPHLQSKRQLSLILWACVLFASFLVLVSGVSLLFLRFYFYVEFFRVLLIGFIFGRYARTVGPTAVLVAGSFSLLYFSLRFNFSAWDYIDRMPGALFVDISRLADRVDLVYRGY